MKRPGSIAAAIPRLENGRGPVLVTPALLDRIGFTDHALERFASRAGLRVTDRRILEPLIRDLVLQEGLLVRERPRWARSRNTADLYLQLGEWMLFIGEHDERPHTDFAIVTVVNGRDGNTWQNALSRGYIFTPPPPAISRQRCRRPSLLVSTLVAVRDRRRRTALDERLPGAIRRTHEARQARAQDAYERAISEGLRLRDRRYERARRRARRRHLARYRLS